MTDNDNETGALTVDSKPVNSTEVARNVTLDAFLSGVDTSAAPIAAVPEVAPSCFNYQFATTEDHVACLVADPLVQLERDLIDCGLEPVLPTATLIYLAKASAYAGRPVSLQIRGDSESFKSMTVSLVVRLHPEIDVIQRQSITWAALMDGLGRGGDLRRMTICLDENVESRKRDHDLMGAIRELTTKEKVTRTKMQRNVPVDITLLGPATIIDCMLTDTKLTDQDVNRFLVLAMPDDPGIRSAICDLNAERFDERGAQRRALIDDIANGHKAYLSQLDKRRTVHKPLLLRGSNVSPRFDSSVFGLVCTTAWLRQGNGIDVQEPLTATLEDYEYVWRLLRDARVLFPKTDMRGSAARLLEAWRDLARREGDLPLPTPELRAGVAPRMDLSAFGRIVNELIKAGYAVLARRGPRGLKFQQLTDLGLAYTGCDLVAQLPTPNSLRSAQACAAPRSDQPQDNERVTSQ